MDERKPPPAPGHAEPVPERPSALGKYAGIIGTSDEFAALKQAEIDLEDRGCGVTG
jgi:hypothetical protein